MKIILGVSSSISIYKACEVLRQLQKENMDVHVIMTPNAGHMVAPLLFGALSGNPVGTDVFQDETAYGISHISLARNAALYLVAPATANLIAKFATGIADDFPSTFFLAADCPVLIAPAMNRLMYKHAQTQENIRRLRGKNVHFVEPGEGYLACGDEGAGRLAEPESIVSRGLQLIRGAQSLTDKTVMITAGPTREYLDPVRFFSNRSSGKMGFALAEEARRRGAKVLLISGPVAVPPPAGIRFVQVGSTEEMARAVDEEYLHSDIVLMAAAVMDFTPRVVSGQKIKKAGMAASVAMKTTPDILEGLGREKAGKILVGFAAETENIMANARRKLKRKNCDLLVVNDVSRHDIGFESDDNQVALVTPDGDERVTEKVSKLEISRTIWDRIEEIIEKNR